MKIEINDDFLDEVVGSALIACYVNNEAHIKKLKKKKVLSEFEEEDFEMFKKLLPALEIVATWFVYDFKGKVKKMKEDL